MGVTAEINRLSKAQELDGIVALFV